MTKANYQRKYRVLVREVSKSLREFGDRALCSGAFDLPTEPDDWRLVKNVLCAALEREAGGAGYGPVKRTDRRAIKNIRRCTSLS